MTVKELKKLLDTIPDDYLVWDCSCCREITIDSIWINHEDKFIGYSN